MIIEVSECRYGKMMYLTNDSYIGKSLQKYGEYSQSEMDLMAMFLKPGMCCLDIGANMGTHTVFLANTVGPKGRVVAAEPQKQFFHMMVGNLALNELINVDPMLCAVGKEMGTIEIPIFPSNADLNFGSLSLPKIKDYNPELASLLAYEPVKLMTIDSWNIKREVHFIKMDIEGMEYDALLGAEQTINNYNPVMYIEWSREAGPDVIDHLKAKGYRIYWHGSLGYNPNNFRGDKENIWDNNGTNNMLCVPPYLKDDWEIRFPEVLNTSDINPDMIPSDNAVFH